jgi:hypothetical protein
MQKLEWSVGDTNVTFRKRRFGCAKFIIPPQPKFPKDLLVSSQHFPAFCGQAAGAIP